MPENLGGVKPDEPPSSSGGRKGKGKGKGKESTRPHVERFKGHIDGLEKSVFDIQQRESDAFNISLRNIAEHIATTVPNGGEFL